MRNLSKVSRCPSCEPNLGSPEFKSRALTLQQPARFLLQFSRKTEASKFHSLKYDLTFFYAPIKIHSLEPSLCAGTLSC
jgi:hypothetical protein